jgi:hypothetical protein
VRYALAIAFALLASTAAAAEPPTLVVPGGPSSGWPVRLDRAGLEALARGRPEHHAAIQELLRARSVVGDEALPGCGGVSYGVRSLDVSPILLTTHPPQRELRFAIDEVSYRMRVTAHASPRILTAEGELPSGSPCPPRGIGR